MDFDANDEHRKVQKHIRNGQFAKAVEVARGWIQHCPDDVNAYVMAASASKKMGDHGLAIEFGQKACEISPHNIFALIQLSSAYLKEDLNLAFEHAENAVHHHPQNAEAYIARAWAQAMRGNLTETDDDCSLARKFGASSDRVRPLVEFTALKRNEFDDTFDDCRAAVQKTPTDGAGFVWRAWAKSMLYDFPGAVEDCEKGLALKSCVSRARLQRAYAYEAMNDLKKADEDYRVLVTEITDTDNLRPNVLLLKASLLESNRYFEDALNACNKAIKLKSDSESAILMKAGLLSSLHRFGDAMLTLEQLKPLELSFRMQASALSSKARIHLDHGEVEDALRDSTVAVGMVPGVAWIISNHGQILTRAGQLEEAEKALTQAISINKYARETYWFRYELLTKQGKTDQATADRRIAERYNYIPYK